MKLTSRDLIKLQWPLIIMVALIAAAILLAFWAAQGETVATQGRNEAQTRKNQIEQRLRQVRTEEEELRERAATFQQLRASGISGEEKRLEWTELLGTLQRELRLPGMRYEFGVQKPMENVSGSAHAFFSSPLRLQLRLLHERDLLDFLGQTEAQAKAMVLVKACKLAPAVGSTDARSFGAQLTADCDMQWITVRRSTGAK